jgi:hypothetical protein
MDWSTNTPWPYGAPKTANGVPHCLMMYVLAYGTPIEQCYVSNPTRLAMANMNSTSFFLDRQWGALRERADTTL